MANLFKKASRKNKGSSLALVTAIGLGIILVILFWAVIYSQQFTQQKEAQTAVDSAALAVAKEISLVSITDPGLGIVGVTDQFRAGGPAQGPIYGINTLVGRARLDAVIANNLNNEDMELLANRDTAQVMAAATTLRGALAIPTTGILRYTSPNGVVTRNLKQIAAAAYNSNPTRAANSPNVAINDVTVETGYVNNNAAGLTDIPIPMPNDLSLGANTDQFSGQVGGQRFYRAGVSAPVPGIGGQYVFSAISRQQRLVDRTAFVAAAPHANLVPTVVRVTIRQQVSRSNPSTGVNLDTGTAANRKVEVAAATAGGERVPTTAGLFRLEFPQGIPQDQDSGNRFNSILSIMNAGAAAWNGNASFFTAKDGPFPGSGYMAPARFPAGVSVADSRDTANPSQVTAYYVYDWLRNDCLRPNVRSVITAMNAPLRTQTTTTADASKAIFDQAGGIFIQKAYAATAAEQCNRIWGGLFALIPDSTKAMKKDSGDGRSLANFDKNKAESRNTFLDQFYIASMQASTPQQLAFAPGQTIAIGINSETGCATTVNGEPISEALDLREDIAETNNISSDSYDAGDDVQIAAYKAIVPLQAAQNEQLDIVAAIDAVVATMDYGPFTFNNGASSPQGLSGLGSTNGYAGAKTQRDTKQATRNAPIAVIAAIQTQINAENRKINRAAIVMNNAIQIIAAVSGIPPYKAPGIPGLINNLKAISSLGIDRVIPTDSKSVAKPRQYLLADSIDYFPPTVAATVSGIQGFASSIAAGQYRKPGAAASALLGNNNWLSNPRVFSGSTKAFGSIVSAGTAAGTAVEIQPGLVKQINCPPSVQPSSQTRNFEFLSVGDASLGGQGAIRLEVSALAPTNGNGAPLMYDQSKNALGGGAYKNEGGNSLENATGTSALLEGQSRVQGLNILSVKSKCDRDADNGRYDVLWSVIGLCNCDNFSRPAVDLRNEATPGNKLDCGRASTGGNPQERICDNEAVRLSFQSPLPYTPPLKVVPLPPKPRSPIPPVQVPPAPSPPPPTH